MLAPLGIGFLLLLVGLVMFFVPGIGIFGVVLILLGFVFMAASFTSSRRRSTPPPA